MFAVYSGYWDCAKIIAVSQCGEGVSKVKTPRSNSLTAPNVLAQVCRFDGSCIDRYWNLNLLLLVQMSAGLLVLSVWTSSEPHSLITIPTLYTQCLCSCAPVCVCRLYVCVCHYGKTANLCTSMQPLQARKVPFERHCTPCILRPLGLRWALRRNEH